MYFGEYFLAQRDPCTLERPLLLEWLWVLSNKLFLGTLSLSPFLSYLTIYCACLGNFRGVGNMFNVNIIIWYLVERHTSGSVALLRKKLHLFSKECADDNWLTK